MELTQENFKTKLSELYENGNDLTDLDELTEFSEELNEFVQFVNELKDKWKKQTTDNYPLDLLRDRIDQFDEYYKSTLELQLDNKTHIDMPEIPKDIICNIVKTLILQIEGDECLWVVDESCKSMVSGKLIFDDIDDKIEVKTLTGNDDSFTIQTRKNFDVLYILDVREWSKNLITLWKVNLSSTDETFQSLTVLNKKLKDIKSSSIRLRLHSLIKQIPSHCWQMYNGDLIKLFE